jgi:hypothetical protein
MQLPSDVTLVAFDVLMDFVELYDYVKRDSKVMFGPPGYNTRCISSMLIVGLFYIF